MLPTADETGRNRPRAEGFALAPLVEAVLDVQFQESLSPEQVEAGWVRLADRYPSLRKMHQQQVRFDAESESLSIQDPTVHFRGEGEDTTQVAILRPDGIATSQLAPYRDWDSLSGRFNHDLTDVLAAVGDRPFRRMAVRSINRIDVPPDGPVVRYEDYLTVYPIVPSQLDPLNTFQLSLSVPVPEVGGDATVMVYRVPGAVEGKASFIVDVDVYRQENVPSAGSDFAELLLAFRDAKNRIYRACLTPRALKEFQE